MTKEIIESVDQASASKEPDLFPLVDHDQSPTISLAELRKMGLVFAFESPTIDQSQVDGAAEIMLRNSLFESDLRSRLRRTYLKSRKSPADREEIAKKLRLQERSLRTVFLMEYPQFISTEAEEIDLMSSESIGGVTFETNKPGDPNTEPLTNTNQLHGAFRLIDLTNEIEETDEDFDPEILEAFREDMEKGMVGGEEPTQYDYMIPSDIRKKDYPIEDSYDDDSRP